MIWLVEVVIIYEEEIYIGLLESGSNIRCIIIQIVGGVVLKMVEGFQCGIFMDVVLIIIVGVVIVVILDGVMVCIGQQWLYFGKGVGMGIVSYDVCV